MKQTQLLELAVEGDRCALRSLFERHGTTVMRRITIPRAFRGMLSAEDVMQETYIDAFTDIGGFVPRGESSFVRWLGVLARHNLTSALRMLRAERRGGAWRRVEPAGSGSTFAFGLAATISVTASRVVRAHEREGLLLSAIERLPLDHRIVLCMYDLESRSMEEVARRLGRSRGAAYMLRARALSMLKPILGRPSMYSS